jgi:hypothetical protein
MFSFSNEDLRLRILDCPGGGASLTASVKATGGESWQSIRCTSSHPAKSFDAWWAIACSSRLAKNHPPRAAVTTSSSRPGTSNGLSATKNRAG